MQRFFETIKEYRQNGALISAVVVSGEGLGNRALWQKQNGFRFFNGNKTFWQAWETKFATIKHAQIVQTAETQIFFEVLLGDPKLIICGGGHISVPLADFAKKLNFQVAVIEDRTEMATSKRFPNVDQIISLDFAGSLEKIPNDSNNYYVIVTRDPYYDIICLKQILTYPRAYIGMIGNKTRVGKVRKGLIKAGFAEDIINQIYSPVGLKIGAETPAEISISILAEIIKVKSSLNRDAGFAEDILAVVLADSLKENPMCLATIINRKGSMPRQISTKMLVLADGHCVNTVGGGKAEEEIRQAALRAMTLNQCSRLAVDTTGKHIKDDNEGFTGGVSEVFLEPFACIK